MTTPQPIPRDALQAALQQVRSPRWPRSVEACLASAPYRVCLQAIARNLARGLQRTPYARHAQSDLFEGADS